MVAGLLRPSAGRIERAGVALADEGLALDRELPLGRALAFWGGPKLGEALTAFDLDRLAEVPVRLLSTGQAQARAAGAGDGERGALVAARRAAQRARPRRRRRGSTRRLPRIARAAARCSRRAMHALGGDWREVAL